jgi:dienelactone hydrolase
VRRSAFKKGLDVDWTSEHTENGIVTREWTIRAGGRTVPGILWTPGAQDGPRPLVLVGHGGAQHKSGAPVLELVRRLVPQHGLAVAAIDGPIHGARRSSLLVGPDMQKEFLAQWERDTLIDPMVEDWRGALDALLTLPQVDPQAVGWWGVSMGTAYGLPFVAAEPRIRCALLGLWSASYTNSQRLVADAPSVTCPTLFLQRWHDQIFDRQGQFDLFAALGAQSKWLKVGPGPHALDEDLFDDSVAFLLKHLGK